MKKKVIICMFSILIIMILTFGAISVFWYYHPTHYAYNDRFIIGSTRARIEEEYGPFTRVENDTQGNLHCGIYMIHDNTPELIMGYDDSLWYEVYFKSDIAVSVKLREGYKGG